MNQNTNQHENLQKFAINLCERASQGKLDPVIGRDDEIRRVLQILSRRTKNNPILIGEPGVVYMRHHIVTNDLFSFLRIGVVDVIHVGFQLFDLFCCQFLSHGTAE